VRSFSGGPISLASAYDSARAQPRKLISGFSSATKLLTSGVALFIRCLRFLFAEFLEARIIPKRIEHRIEPEQRGSKRDAHTK
jgi:hypothetical protein